MASQASRHSFKICTMTFLQHFTKQSKSHGQFKHQWNHSCFGVLSRAVQRHLQIPKSMDAQVPYMK
jgi:hypothetical protein